MRRGFGQFFAGNQFFNLGHRRRHAFAGLALAQVRSEHVLQYPFGVHVGNRTLQAAPHRQMGFALVAHQQQQNAVADVFAAQLPFLHHPRRVVERRFRTDGRHGQHGNLAAFLTAVLQQVPVQLFAFFGLQHLRGIHYRIGQFWDGGQVGGKQPHAGKQHGQKRAQPLYCR